MAKFVPNLTVKTTALRQLLLEKNDWPWEAEQAKEWQDIKDFFMMEPLLKLYDPARRSKISSDASKDGLGEPYFYRSTMEIGFQLRSSRVP